MHRNLPPIKHRPRHWNRTSVTRTTRKTEVGRGCEWSRAAVGAEPEVALLVLAVRHHHLLTERAAGAERRVGRNGIGGGGREQGPPGEPGVGDPK